MVMGYKYGTLVISANDHSLKKEYVEACIKVLMNVDGKMKNGQKWKVFEKCFIGPVWRLEEIFSEVFSHPIDTKLFGETTFLDKVRYVELRLPSTPRGKWIADYVEGVVESSVPKKYIFVNYF